VKKAALPLSLLIWLSATVYAQNTPPLLAGAAHCLTTKNFVPPSPSASRTFGYFLDEKSYPGQKAIYVVNYRQPARSNGWVFVVFVTEHDGQQHFNIQNNATFVLSKRDFDGISFVGTGQPLGGIWTQQHIAMAIRRIEKQPRFTLNDKDLSVALPSVTCESYTEDSRSHF
jgi:hypothetical protein